MPNRQVKFSYYLDPEEQVLLRANFVIQAGIIEKFAVQLELDSEIVIRFDNSHGYVHQHIFLPSRSGEIRRLKFTDGGSAYKYCYQYLRANWISLIEDFRRQQ